mmetsp:Transcript_25862/g.29450  ORF Transcript_25862/g.29450 Transcript_25862/m.29450 type:complete len:169 (-) Transcript_25862:161-667(-)
MSTENTSTKIVTPAGDSHSELKMIIDKRSIYQNPFFIIASSLLALLVLVVVTSKSGDQNLTTVKYVEYDESKIHPEERVAVNIFGNEVDGTTCSQGPNPAPGGVTIAHCPVKYCNTSGHCREVCCNDTYGHYTKPNCCMCKAYCHKYCTGCKGHCTACPCNPGYGSCP